MSNITEKLNNAFGDSEKTKEKLQNAFGDSANTSSAVHMSVEEASAFFDTIVEKSVLLKKVRTEKMDFAKKNLQRLISDGEFLRPGADSFDDSQADKVDVKPIEIITKEVQGSFFIYDKEKRHNIEGQSFGEHMLNIMATKAANSLEKLAILGDTDEASFTGDKAVYKQFDGFFKQIKEHGNYIDASQSSIFADDTVTREKFVKMYTTLDPAFRDQAEFFLHDNVVVEYDELFTGNYNRNNLVDNILSRPMIKVPLAPTKDGKTKVLLTDPKNLIFAVQVETANITFEKVRNAKMKRDEWYFNMEIAFAVEAPDKAVLLDNLKMKY